MIRNRLILLFLILAAGTFASFYGGISYLPLFILFILPMVSFLYLVYVFFSLRISQSVDERVLYKGEETSYWFVLVNEKKVVYPGIRVSFKSGLYEASGLEESWNYSLLPKDRIEKHAQSRCLYRGHYPVGVDTIVVTDFLNLFRLKRSAGEEIPVQVLPRVVRLNRLAAAPLDEDAKAVPFSMTHTNDQPDVESRSYTPGDGLKMVNWKLSARQQELLVRKYIDTPKTKILLIMDLAEIRPADPVTRIIIEDKIIETSLAIADYFVRRKTPLEVIYGTDRPQGVSMEIQDQGSFDRFYRVCSDIPFRSLSVLPSLLRKAAYQYSGRSYCIIVTHKLDEELCRAAENVLSLNTGLCIIQIGDERQEGPRHNLDKRVRFFRISKEQEIAEVLDMQRGGRIP